MRITVYTGPACMACRMTKNKLDQAGVVFDEVDTTVPAHADRLRDLGLTSLPVVEVELPDGTDRWAGMQPANLRALVDMAATA